MFPNWECSCYCGRQIKINCQHRGPYRVTILIRRTLKRRSTVLFDISVSLSLPHPDYVFTCLVKVPVFSTGSLFSFVYNFTQKLKWKIFFRNNLFKYEASTITTSVLQPLVLSMSGTESPRWSPTTLSFWNLLIKVNTIHEYSLPREHESRVFEIWVTKKTLKRKE